MKIKLIATDMDGTFLDDAKHAPDENIKALAECAERGIHIVPATGRIINAIPDEIKNLPGVHYVIAVNGAVVADLKTGEVISTCKMSSTLAVKIMEMARDSEDDIMYDAYVSGMGRVDERFYVNVEHYVQSPGVVELVRKSRRPVADCIAYVKTCGEEVEKVNMLFIDMEARERMREKLSHIPEVVVTSAIANNLEINAAGADKGGALLRLAEYLGLSREETMAFGDGENDLSMIKAAGIGVAMKNGEESVKAVADHVTTTNNEAGVAAAIRRFVL